MTKYLYMLLILFTSMGTLIAQYKIKSKPDNVSKKSVSIPFSEVASSDKIISISGKGYAIFEKTLGDQKTYYLYNTEKQKKVKDLLTNSLSTGKGNVEFSDNDRFILIEKLNGKNGVLDIFDTNNEESFVISSDRGNVAMASIYDKNKFIYEVQPGNERPKYFINSEESNSKFIAEGTAGKWAPNGDIFILHRNKSSDLTILEQINYKRISRKKILTLRKEDLLKEKVEYVNSIFNQKGELLLDLDEMDVINWFEWSADSKKILMESSSYKGFYIITFGNSGSNIKVENTQYFSGFEDNNEGRHYCAYPRWSPDGKKILFTKITEPDDYISLYNLWILDISSFEYYPIDNKEYEERIESKWIDNNNLFFIKKNIKNQSNENIFKLFFK